MGDPAGSIKGLVYVADDEPMLVEMAGAILHMEGYTTKQFFSAESALEELDRSKDKPVLVVTDWLMGGMTGIEFIQQVKQKVPSIKTILLSGTIEEAAIQNQPVKPDKFLAKPYQVKALLDAVHRVMQPG